MKIFKSKKLIITFLLLAIVAILGSCGKDTATTSGQTFTLHTSTSST